MAEHHKRTRAKQIQDAIAEATGSPYELPDLPPPPTDTQFTINGCIPLKDINHD